jgi:hypothetical protein
MPRNTRRRERAREDPLSGRIEFNGSTEGPDADTSGSAAVESDGSASTPSTKRSSSKNSSGGSRKKKNSPESALERELLSDFERSAVEDSQPTFQILLCDLDDSFPVTDFVRTEVAKFKRMMSNDSVDFTDRFTPDDSAPRSKDYRVATRRLTRRLVCDNRTAVCLLEMSRSIRADMLQWEDLVPDLNVSAHLGLAMAIAALFQIPLRRPPPSPANPSSSEEAPAGTADQNSDQDTPAAATVQGTPATEIGRGAPPAVAGQGSDAAEPLVAPNNPAPVIKVPSTSPSQPDSGIPAADPELLVSRLADEVVSRAMRNSGEDKGASSQHMAEGISKILGASLEAIQNLLRVSVTGVALPVQSDHVPPTPPPDPDAVPTGVQGGGTASQPAKKRIEPNLIQQLGQGYRVGGGAVIDDSMCVSKLAREKKKVEHVVARAAAAIDVVPRHNPKPADCEALLKLPGMSEELWELTRTVQKVLQRRPDIAKLPKAERMRKATRMASRELHKEEVRRLREQTKSLESGGSGDDDSPSDSSSDESVGDTVGSDERRSSDSEERSSNSDGSFVETDRSSGSDDSDGERDRDKRKRLQQRTGSMNSLGTPKASKRGTELPAFHSNSGLVMLGDDGLKLWKIGTAKYNQGLNWVAYLHHKQAFDNYKQHGGRYSERTFKSVIHANLVPTVCAACGFDRAKWDRLSDSKLILALEKVLRPSRSTDFAVELRELRIMKNSDEPLLARYEAFAERFLYKCAEAEDAGKRIKWNVVKNAFNDALKSEMVLKHWMQEVKWSGVAKAHKRLLRKLREARSIEQLFHKGKTNLSGGARGRGEAEDEEGSDPPSRARALPKKRVPFGRKLKSNAARKSKQAERSSGGVVNHAGVQADRGKSWPAKGDKGPKLRQWKYDKRGPSWHTDHDLYDCYDRPCKRPFCQRCREHGHTAEYCRKPDDVPGITRDGYAQETAAGKAALRRPPPERTVKNNGMKGSKASQRSDDQDCSEEEEDQRSSGSDGDDQAGQHTSGRSKGKGNAARANRGRRCL